MLQDVQGAPPLPVVGSLRLVAGNPQLVDMPQLVVVDTPLVDRKSTRLNSSHPSRSRMPSSA